MNNLAPEILIIRLSALGDVIATVPLAAAIKHQIPGARITWLVEKMSAPLLFNNPVVDRVIVFPGKSLIPNSLSTPPVVNPAKALSDFWREFRAQNYDIAIDAQGLFKSAFLGWLSGAKIRLGFAHTREWADKFLTHPLDIGDVFAHDKHIIDSYHELALKLFAIMPDVIVNKPSTFSFPEFSLPVVPEEAKQKIQNWLNILASTKISSPTIYQDENETNPLVVLIPGTTWPTKIWPIAKWQKLGHLLIERLGYKVILCGGVSEIFINKQLEENLQHLTNHPQKILNLTGQTNLLELIALFEQSNLVIGGDTGPLHLANAVGKAKIIGIFGSTPWKRNGPYGKQALSIALNLDCQPCFAKTCRLNTTACLNDLSAEYVYEQILNFIPKPSGQ